jgi:multidrug efflux pump subunit AcrA (membrane-fusion protein)
MNGNTISISRGTAIASALGLVILGAVGTFGWIRAGGDAFPRQTTDARGTRAPGAPMAPPSTPTAPSQSAVLRLSPEAIARAGIAVATVTGASGDASIRVPGVVQPNNYKQVVVSPLVAGRVTRVQAELGQRVRRGQLLASIYGPDAAEAQARLLAARAGLEAHDRELRRTEQLVGIGAASRQELERLHAEHAAKLAEVESARARLDVIGGGPGQEESGPSRSTAPSNTVDVRAPIDGTVVERSANAGLNVEVGTPLFTIADLSTVWVVGELYEQDFARVRLGTKALVTIPGSPEPLPGTVSYIDPQVSAATRTGKVRVELSNPAQRMRFGMYVDLQLGAAGSSASGAGVMVAKSAVQTVGDRAVVYVNDAAAGQFSERTVTLGAAIGQQVQVIAGLSPGESVVVAGSFFLRAEAERLGLRPTTATEQTFQVNVTAAGFQPSTLTMKAGVPARVTFRRTAEPSCATEVMFPALKIRRALPLNQPVEVRFTPAAGDIAFACGIDMFRGTVVAR